PWSPQKRALSSAGAALILDYARRTALRPNICPDEPRNASAPPRGRPASRWNRRARWHLSARLVIARRVLFGRSHLSRRPGAHLAPRLAFRRAFVRDPQTRPLLHARGG